MRIIKTKKQQLDKKVFKYLDDNELPVLVLALRHKHDLRKYNFAEKREFVNIHHQTAGNACHDNYMTGTILIPRAETYEGMIQVDNYWRGLNCGAFSDASLDDILEYRSQLKELFGADCNFSYKDFEEGIYPIDCLEENLRKLSLDKFSININNFDGLIKWNSESERLSGCINRLSLYILGHNRV